MCERIRARERKRKRGKTVVLHRFSEVVLVTLCDTEAKATADRRDGSKRKMTSG